MGGALVVPQVADRLLLRLRDQGTALVVAHCTCNRAAAVKGLENLPLGPPKPMFQPFSIK